MDIYTQSHIGLIQFKWLYIHGCMDIWILRRNCISRVCHFHYCMLGVHWNRKREAAYMERVTLKYDAVSSLCNQYSLWIYRRKCLILNAEGINNTRIWAWDRYQSKYAIILGTTVCNTCLSLAGVKYNFCMKLVELPGSQYARTAV